MKYLRWLWGCLAWLWTHRPKEPADPCAAGHDKCYSPSVLAVNPPIYRWVCRRCKAQGEDRGQQPDFGEYERLIKEQ